MLVVFTVCLWLVCCDQLMAGACQMHDKIGMVQLTMPMPSTAHFAPLIRKYNQSQ